MNTTFTKSDLQTGMVVQLADNSYWWVIRNVLNASGTKPLNYIREATETDGDFLDLGNYTEDLLWDMETIPGTLRDCYTDQHIQKVFCYKYAYDVIQTLPEYDMEANSTPIWERKPIPEPKTEPKDLTLDEIEKLLGYPIRITNTKPKGQTNVQSETLADSEEPNKLTIDTNELPNWVNWAARDKTGSLWMYEGKPTKETTYWDHSGGYSEVIDGGLYPSIKWIDPQPTKIVRRQPQ